MNLAGSTLHNPSWQCRSVSVRDPNAPELRSVAPLVALGEPVRFVAPITVIAHGSRVIGVTSAELLRTNPDARLAIASRLDGTGTIDVLSWSIGRYAGVGLVELDGAFPTDGDVVPLPIGSVHASVGIHGAPAAIVTIEQVGARFERSLIPVHVDGDDAGGMSDTIVYLASPMHPAHAEVAVEGACLFAWLPPEPALGRPKGEVVGFALGYPYRIGIAKPRATPVIAELAGLEDLGRALISKVGPEKETELRTVSGEIVDTTHDPLAGLEE